MTPDELLDQIRTHDEVVVDVTSLPLEELLRYWLEAYDINVDISVEEVISDVDSTMIRFKHKREFPEGIDL